MMSIDNAFFKELWKIQEEIINIIPLRTYKSTKEELEAASYEIICGIMEIFDSIHNGIKYDIRICEKGIIINKDIFCLHDMWYDYLFCFERSNPINQYLKKFFSQLKSIMNDCVDFTLKNEKYYNSNIYVMLTSITFKIIYKIMEFIDGFGKNRIRYELIDTKNGIILNDGNCKLLHSMCADYLL